MKTAACIAAVCIALGCAAAPPPETGDDATRFAKFDQVLRDFAQSNGIFAATAAAGEGGRIVHARSIGYADRERTKPLPINARYRIASVTKPVTAAAVKALIREGTLQAETPVLDVLKTPPWPAPQDGRWRDITVQHLLEHRGGWDRDEFGDPMFMQVRILKETGRAPDKPADVIHWMLGQPLQFTPGEKSVYANFGYCVLGRVLETATKKKYMAFVQETVAKPCGISSWALARGGADPLKEEVWYDFDGERGEYFRIGLMDAHGGLVSTASDLCRFLSKFWLSGEPRKGGRGRICFFGSLPGTTAIASQRADGLDYAVLLNKRSNSNDVKWHEQLQQLLDAALD